MTCRITVLCDNSVGPLSGTLAEHGFAALIEPSAGQPILFDTGQGMTLISNAARMRRDLTQVGQVVLSHGHYDHTGGLIPLLEQTGPKQVLAHPGIFTPRYRIRDTGEMNPIGVPFTTNQAVELGASFDLEKRWRELAPGIWLTGEIARQTTFERGDAGIYCDTAGCAPDVVPDDQSLVLQTSQGLLLLLGCCHAGIINTLEHVAARLGQRNFYALIGGLHLGFCESAQINETLRALKGYRLKKIAVSHCTGFAASSRLAQQFGKEFHLAQVGYTLQVNLIGEG